MTLPSVCVVTPIQLLCVFEMARSEDLIFYKYSCASLQKPPKLAWSKMKEYTKEQRTWIVLSKLPPTRRVKIDTYEYESLAKDILDEKVSYNSMIEIFNDKIYWDWFYKNYIQSQNVFTIAKITT